MCLVGLVLLLPACSEGWKNLPVPPRAPPPHVTHAALAPERPYALPDLPPTPPHPPWPRGAPIVIDVSPLPKLPVRDRTVRDAETVAIEETWSSLGGSGTRRVTLRRDGGRGVAFEATGRRSDREYRGWSEVLRRGRIADDRLERLVVRLAALGHERPADAGPTAVPPRGCTRPTCAEGRLTVSATTRGGRTAAYTNALDPCSPEWRHDGVTMDLDVPGVADAARELLALTVDAANATNATNGARDITFTEDDAFEGAPPTK